MQMPVVGEVGKQRRQYRGKREPGFLRYPARRVIADGVQEFQSFQRSRSRQR